ncbi:AMP-binding protein [Nonomuraea typhae]|uniref:AMP-binding protein n=1 Tax=Nonomuraea typhae TaxID=2603600 RepID=UPI0012FB36BE|nr:AMP-binding protein [Nonomuraea typhae]
MTADTFAALLAARADDDRVSLYYGEQVWSWREHVALSHRYALWGASAGHVGVLLDNVPELVFLVGGAALGGAVVVALNPTRSPVELVRDARAADVGLVVWDEPYGEAARAIGAALGVRLAAVEEVRRAVAEPSRSELGDADPGDLVMLVFTSGTSSGRPRAVRVTQRKLAVPGLSLARMLGPEDVAYCSMPLFHSGAIMAAYAPAVAAGAGLVLRRRFSASGLLPDVRKYGCTYLHYVGKALSYVLATPELGDDADNPLKLAFGNEGSATATRRFGERFGCFVIDAFGSTETAVSITPDPSGPPGCLGRLPEGVEIRDPVTGERCPPAVLEEGRLVNAGEAVGELVNVRGLGLFDGYYNDPEADAERIREGAYWSGDLAYADKEGYVFFAGRGTERLRVDGENLAVAPIEAVAREAPGVLEAAVYPVPDSAAGDQVMLALIPAGREFDVTALGAFLESRQDLGIKAIPRYIRVCREFPLTPSHKVIKRLLARQAWHATTDPLYLRTPTGYRPLTGDDVVEIETEFARHGRRHLLET